MSGTDAAREFVDALGAEKSPERRSLLARAYVEESFARVAFVADDGSYLCPTGSHGAPPPPVTLDEHGMPTCSDAQPCKPRFILDCVTEDSDASGAVEQLALADQAARVHAEVGARRTHNDDLGNAQLFAEQHATKLRWSPSRNKWLVWTGTHWRPDSGVGAAMRCAGETARSLSAMAATEPNEAVADQLRRRAANAGSRQRLDAMIAIARAYMEVREEDLDNKAWLLNVANGTIELCTGELRAHDPADLITLVCPVPFEPGARSERWEHFLGTSIPDDGERAFLQRLGGYCLVGENTEEKFFFVQGPGGSGKSTFVEALASTLGPYAKSADPSVFLKSQRPADPTAANSAVAHLVGSRLVVSTEPPKGRQLDEGFMKRLTGGDTLTTRPMYGSTFEFKANFTIVLVGNSRPAIDDDSGGAMRRRLVEVPFPVPAGDHRDDSLKQELTDPARSGAAILAWLVRGCLDWKAHGLGQSAVVEAATAANWQEQAENDPVATFLEDHYELTNSDADAVPRKHLASHFASASGARLSPRELTRRLRELGLGERKSGGVRFWVGIRAAPVGVTPPARLVTWSQLLDGAEPRTR